MRYEETITVSKERVRRLIALCETPPGRDGVERDEAVETLSATFRNGWVMDVKIVAPSDPDEAPCWTEAVLSRPAGIHATEQKTLQEICCSEPSEGVFGEWLFEVFGNTYVVNVVEGE